MAEDCLTDIEDRIIKAHARYGPIASTHEAMGVALEEWTELIDAVRANKLGSVEWEALDLAAVLLRLARTIRNNHQQFANRSTK